jgi:ribosomal protein S4E
MFYYQHTGKPSTIIDQECNKDSTATDQNICHSSGGYPSMKTKPQTAISDGDRCTVVGGTHKGKSGTVSDIHTSKTGHVTITVTQSNGERFKTLARNVDIPSRRTNGAR